MPSVQVDHKRYFFSYVVLRKSIASSKFSTSTWVASFKCSIFSLPWHKVDVRVKEALSNSTISIPAVKFFKNSVINLEYVLRIDASSLPGFLEEYFEIAERGMMNVLWGHIAIVHIVHSRFPIHGLNNSSQKKMIFASACNDVVDLIVSKLLDGPSRLRRLPRVED